MPELPEVETTVRLIRPQLVGRTIRGARVAWRRTVGARAFEARVARARITDVRRRAKYFVIELERGRSPAGGLLGHLRMTGRVLVTPAGAPDPEYGKVALALDDGTTMHFVDVRKFGRLVWHADPARELAALGPEPLGEVFTADWLGAALRTRKRALKPLLLDQTFVAGLGNIYVDESLHRAGLHPLARADRVKPREAERLWREIRAVLTEAIAREGSSFDAFYRTPEGKPGSYQEQFRVYGRDGQPCRTCRATIARLVVGQRGTHLCPRCQRRPRTR
ncbi:MAG: bifunctional DNA-formamidopyrimidine glycosylase/DNA-(apurinic or apyrimidinic site) lyase [Planctomycetes bacterium]|nr:bifunctional DNA-formamidopyrimidine glycosylase/DNA-(apurinic or apyrimidinic site) lyase [Planctomycetota bacterium]